MLISYEQEYLRECCLLLKPGSLNSGFKSIEIKAIRACISDLKAAPKLIDSPLSYSINHQEGTVEFKVDNIQIICQIISSYKNPTDSKIERLKVLKIINSNLELDLKQKRNK